MLSYDDFPRRLKWALQLSGKNYDDIGRETGLSPSLISAACNGRHRPRIDTVVRICNAIGIGVDELLKTDERVKKNYAPQGQEDNWA